VVARVGLDRRRRATVRVALAQDRVDGAALDLVIALARRALLVVGRLVGVIGDVVALLLELGDGRLELGTEALMLGSLMMLASGVVASSPSSARSSATRCSSVRRSGNWARIRPAREMSRSSMSTPATEAKAPTIGSSDSVASAGASSVWV